MNNQLKPNVAISLLVIHKVITRGLQVAIENLHHFKAQGFPDENTQAGFFLYIRTLAVVIHAHHLTENDLAFPYFKEKLADLPVDVLTEQHREIFTLLDEIQSDSALCEKQKVDLQYLQTLAGRLVKLNGLWLLHIAIEEEHFNVQLIGEMLPAEEQARLIQALAKHNQEHAGPPSLAVPFILFNLPADQRAVIAKGMPEEVTGHLVPEVWKDIWAPMKPFLLA